MADSLDTLLADGVIDEILGRIKSGKEATISMVRRGDAVLAAKVYKDRETRSFKNNVQYKEGRKVRNTRTQRAMDSGGKFGRDAAEQAWKSAEADALFKLVDSGVRTPTPVMFYEGVLLMTLVLDHEGRPAPRLEEITLEPDAVMGVYADIVVQLIALLCCDLVHGDLSPYNILLAAEGPTIIDFPQVISAAHNTRAEHFFLRDFENVHSHLATMDPALAIHRVDGRAIWQAYVRRDLTPQFVPPTPPPLQQHRRNERFASPRPNRPPPTPPRLDDYSASPRRPAPPAPAPVVEVRAARSTEPQPLHPKWTGQETRPAPPSNGRGPQRPNDSRSRRDNARPNARPNDPGANGPRANDPGANGPRANGPRANGPRANGPRANGQGPDGRSSNGQAPNQARDNWRVSPPPSGAPPADSTTSRDNWRASSRPSGAPPAGPNTSHDNWRVSPPADASPASAAPRPAVAAATTGSELVGQRRRRRRR